MPRSRRRPKRPVIGIPADEHRCRDGNKITCLRRSYIDAVTMAGGLPLVLATPLDIDDTDDWLKLVDGVVLTGSYDLDPINDGWQRHARTRTMPRLQEQFLRHLAAEVKSRRMPCLGIGTGMQLLNVTAGGSLSLHIPDDFASAMVHWDAQDENHRHGLKLSKKSMLHPVYGDGDIRVVSQHHMAIDEIGDGFVPTGWAPDKIVEVLESNDPKWFCLGLQFHPEHRYASELDQRIFEVFVGAITGEEPVRGVL